MKVPTAVADPQTSTPVQLIWVTIPILGGFPRCWQELPSCRSHLGTCISLNSRRRESAPRCQPLLARDLIDYMLVQPLGRFLTTGCDH